jgi:hypothetical protein
MYVHALLAADDVFAYKAPTNAQYVRERPLWVTSSAPMNSFEVEHDTPTILQIRQTFSTTNYTGVTTHPPTLTCGFGSASTWLPLSKQPVIPKMAVKLDVRLAGARRATGL